MMLPIHRFLSVFVTIGLFIASSVSSFQCRLTSTTTSSRPSKCRHHFELHAVKNEKGIRAIIGSLFKSGKKDDDDDAADGKTEEPINADTDDDNSNNNDGTPLSQIEQAAFIEGEAAIAMDAVNLAKTTTSDAFEEAEDDLLQVDATLNSIRQMLLQAEARQDAAKTSLKQAKSEANSGLKAAEAAAAQAIAQAQRAERLITALQLTQEEAGSRGAESSAPQTELASPSTQEVSGEVNDKKVPAEKQDDDLSSLSYDDVGYELHEMAPPFLDEDQCLVPGETVVRVEKAPENSRRIFAGIDIKGATVEDVWNVLTNYDRLQDVVPNLVVNDVLERYDAKPWKQEEADEDADLSEEEKLERISKSLRGSKLRQVGGAKVVGINFSARTLLEVREWPEGMPDFAHYDDVDVWEGKSRKARAREGTGLELKRFRFPRPFSLTSLPYKCIVSGQDLCICLFVCDLFSDRFNLLFFLY